MKASQCEILSSVNAVMVCFIDWLALEADLGVHMLVVVEWDVPRQVNLDDV